MLKLVFLIVLVSSFGLSIPLDDEDEDNLYESIFTDGVHMVKNLYKNIFSWFGEDDQYGDYYEGAESNIDKRKHYSSDHLNQEDESSESDDDVDNYFKNFFSQRENRNLKRQKEGRRTQPRKIYLVKNKNPSYNRDKQSHPAKHKHENSNSDEGNDSSSSSSGSNSDSNSDSESGSNSDEDESSSSSIESSRSSRSHESEHKESKEFSHKKNKSDEIISNKKQSINRHHGRHDKHAQQSRKKKYVIGNHNDYRKNEKLIDLNNMNKYKDVKNSKISQKNRNKSKSDEDSDEDDEDDSEDDSEDDEDNDDDDDDDDDEDSDNDDDKQDDSNSSEHKNNTVKQFSKMSKKKPDMTECSVPNTALQESKLKKHANYKGERKASRSKDKNTKKPRKRREKSIKAVPMEKKNKHIKRLVNDKKQYLSKHLSR